MLCLPCKTGRLQLSCDLVDRLPMAGAINGAKVGTFFLRANFFPKKIACSIATRCVSNKSKTNFFNENSKHLLWHTLHRVERNRSRNGSRFRRKACECRFRQLLRVRCRATGGKTNRPPHEAANAAQPVALQDAACQAGEAAQERRPVPHAAAAAHGQGSAQRAAG